MSDIYFPLKWIHIALAFASIAFFLTRAAWAIGESRLLQRRWVKISPHIIDTFLLLAGVALAAMSGQFPIPQPWLAAKLLALCLYIVLGSMAIKRAHTPANRALFAGLALVTFTYMLSVAFSKDPLPFG